jgi:two-component system phosphate regulon sensor histidine kinase PhoR
MVMAKLQKQEAYSFMINTIIIKIVLVKSAKKDYLLEFYMKIKRIHKTIVYSNSIISEDYKISSAFFDKNLPTRNLKILILSVTEVYNDNTIDKSNIQQSLTSDVKLKNQEI